jgi:hypothetical protein
MKKYIPRGHYFHDPRATILVVEPKTGETKPLNFAGGTSRHSPDGFAWGYGGSGPAELARAIIADVTGNPDPPPQLYQKFKADVIVPLDSDSTKWIITEEKVRDWITQYDDWLCSKCLKHPKLMHSTDPNICADCYEASVPGPTPTYTSGDRVVTPDGEGTVSYIIAGENARSTSVCVIIDGARNYGHYKGGLYLAELVTPVKKRRRR